MRARTDPGMVTVMKALLGLWHSDQVAGCVASLIDDVKNLCFGKTISWEYWLKLLVSQETLEVMFVS